MADFIRKQLTNRYGANNTYRQIVHSLTDEEIIQILYLEQHKPLGNLDVIPSMRSSEES
jgi:hypothetical protein